MKEKTWQRVDGAEFPWQYKYAHSAVTNDCVIFTYDKPDLKVLLVERGGEPYKGWLALPGGFLGIGETAREGALRELNEETGLKLRLSGPLTQFGVFSDPDRDARERVLTIAWYGFVRPVEVKGGSDAASAGWYPLSEEILSKLAFDHREIIEAALERIRWDIYVKPVGFELLDETFTIPDLQSLYETILGVDDDSYKFDAGNFHRKMVHSGLLTKTGLMQVNRPGEPRKMGRPAPLYRFNEEEYERQRKEHKSLDF